MSKRVKPMPNYPHFKVPKLHGSSPDRKVGHECILAKPIPAWPLESLEIFNKLPDAALEHIFRQMDLQTLVTCQLVCQLWNKLIIKASPSLPKIRLHELAHDMQYGLNEIALYWPRITRSRRHQLHLHKGRWSKLKHFLNLGPKNTSLAAKMRHFSTEKLQFYACNGRALEGSVLELGSRKLSLNPTEIVFQHCNFNGLTQEELQNFLSAHSKTVRELKLYRMTQEAVNVVNDTSLSFSGELKTLVVHSCYDVQTPFDVTDVTLERMAAQQTCFERIDLTNCKITTAGVKKLIEAWCLFEDSARPQSSKIELQRCNIDKNELFSSCRTLPVVLFDPETSGRTLAFELEGKSLTVYFMDQ